MTRLRRSWRTLMGLTVGLAALTGVAMAQGPQGRGGGGGGPGMSSREHGNIQSLLRGHETIERTVECLDDGVRTRTVTSDPALVPRLRQHVRQMEQRLRQQRPVRLWDPVFRDLFAHADAIQLQFEDIEGGIAVVETSDDPEVVPLIQAHARKVNQFVAEGHAAARPPWAGPGMGMGAGRPPRPPARAGEGAAEVPEPAPSPSPPAAASPAPGRPHAMPGCGCCRAGAPGSGRSARPCADATARPQGGEGGEHGH